MAGTTGRNGRHLKGGADVSSIPDLKRCCGCKGMLPRERFTKNRAQPDGLATHCRECRREQRKRHARDPELRRANDKRFRDRRRARGLCDYCGRPNDRTGKWRCRECEDRKYARRAPLPHRALAAGPCVICGFEYSDVHHIDEDHGNNSPDNLIALCPNHHRLVHRGLLDINSIRKAAP